MNIGFRNKVLFYVPVEEIRYYISAKVKIALINMQIIGFIAWNAKVMANINTFLMYISWMR